VITFSNCVGVLSGSARKRFFLAAEISRDLSAVHGDTRRKRQSHGYQLGVRELQTCTFENIGQNSNRAEFNNTKHSQFAVPNVRWQDIRFGSHGKLEDHPVRFPFSCILA